MIPQRTHEINKQEAWRPNKLHCNLLGPEIGPWGHIIEIRQKVPQWACFRGPKLSEIGPLRPIFNTPLKVAQIDMQSKTDVNPVETL